MNWIDPLKRKPEGEIFWALTEGRSEAGICDWIIRRLFNCKLDNYLSVDKAEAYWLPGTHDRQRWYNIIFAWLPLEAIPINDKDMFNETNREMPSSMGYKFGKDYLDVS